MRESDIERLERLTGCPKHKSMNQHSLSMARRIKKLTRRIAILESALHAADVVGNFERLLEMEP